MADPAAPEQVVCATYTHARRHPIVLGKIGGWTPPFQISVYQLGVIVTVFVVEMLTWRFWSALLPHTPAVVLAIAMPLALAWGARRARIEGRSLLRALAGYLTLLAAPPSGRVGGKPYRHARRSDMRGTWTRVMADER